MANNPDRLKLTEKIGYGVGDTASCLYYQTFSMFLMYFYTDTFGISAATVGLMFLITRIWDVTNDPIMGMIADRTNTRFGKFRPWILWMIIPYAFTGVFLFITPDISLTGKIIYAYITYSLASMAYTAINIPYGALMGVMSSNPDQRTQLSSFRFLGAFTGNIIIQGSLIYLIAFFGKGDKQLGYPMAMGFFAIVASALWLYTFLSTKERIVPPKDQQNKIWQDLKDLGKNKPWLVLCLMGVLTLVWVSIRNGAMLYYFNYYVGSEQKAAPFMVTGTVFSLLGVASTTFIARFLGGKKKAFIVLSALNAVLTGLFFIAKPTDFNIMYATHIFGSFVGGPLMPLTWSMFADTADYAEWKFGRRATGLIFSAGTFSQKMGWTVGGAVAGWVLASYGYQANVEQTSEALLGIRLMMSIFPAIGSFLVCFAAFFYTLSDKKMLEIEKELIERRKSVANP